MGSEEWKEMKKQEAMARIKKKNAEKKTPQRPVAQEQVGRELLLLCWWC